MTIREIARLAGVSPSAVSIVLNGRKGVSEETRRHVQGVIDKYAYEVPRRHKKNDRLKLILIKYRAHGMGIEENQGFIASIVDQMESECRKYGFDLLMCNCNPDTAEEIIKGLMLSPPDGVIFIATEMPRSDYPLLDGFKCPVVVLDNGIRYKNVDSVVMDNEEIALTATRYLYSLGHRQLSYFKTAQRMHNCDERFEGFCRAMEEMGLKAQATVLLTPTLNGAYQDMKRLLQSGEFVPKGAAMADNDTIAIGAIRALQEMGYHVPGDISVIGVDDIPFSAVSMPALTTMRISRTTLGVLAVDTIRKRLQYPAWPGVHTRVVGKLVVRNSTREATPGNPPKDGIPKG